MMNILKRVLRLSAVFLWIGFICATSQRQSSAAEIGVRLANFQLADLSGETWSLRSHLGKTVVLVFWSFKCPVSLSYDSRLEDLRSRYSSQGIVVVGVASNSNESPEEIRANLANRKMALPVLLDSEGTLAEKLGATHAPSVFIVDPEGILRYKGALDNRKKSGEPGRLGYAEAALDSILAQRAIRTAETRPFGCALKQARSASGR